MNLDEKTLIEILDYILALDEQVGLKTETLEDVKRSVSKRRDELKNLRLGSVVKREYTVSGFLDDLFCTHTVEAIDKNDAIRLAKLDFPEFQIRGVDAD